jgi:hypothetical protein
LKSTLIKSTTSPPEAPEFSGAFFLVQTLLINKKPLFEAYPPKKDIHLSRFLKKLTNTPQKKGVKTKKNGNSAIPGPGRSTFQKIP